MKKKIVPVIPFIILPIIVPIYVFLDRLILVDIFGCGCVPIAQTNMLNIPFNANDLRLTVFGILTIGSSIWSVVISKGFYKKITKMLYCTAVILWNIILTLWVIKSFMWG